MSARAPAGLVRAALVLVLVASSLKLLDLPNVVVLTTVAVLAAAGGAHALTRRLAASQTDKPVASPNLFESIGQARD
jgi:hypothetical protein